MCFFVWLPVLLLLGGLLVADCWPLFEQLCALQWPRSMRNTVLADKHVAITASFAPTAASRVGWQTLRRQGWIWVTGDGGAFQQECKAACRC